MSDDSRAEQTCGGDQELARVVGLSPAATLHRIHRLKETGVIRTVAARLDPSAVGLRLVALDVAELRAVLTRLATRAGQRPTTLLKLEEITAISPLPLTTGPQRPVRRRRRGRAPGGGGPSPS